MLLFIGLPIISSFFQSLHIEPEQILMEVEKCDPFGCKTETKVDIEATTKLQEEQPLGRFNGLGTYGDRNHLAFDEIKEAFVATLKGEKFFCDDIVKQMRNEQIDIEKIQFKSLDPR